MSEKQLQTQLRMPDDPFGIISITEQIYGTDVKAYSGNRDAALRELLGTDYEFAHESGLINVFYYDPDTGRDGLMHVLGGEYYETAEGVRVPRGFHHEPSGEVAWVYDDHGNRVKKAKTRVDRSHLADANSSRRKDFLEFPYEPYHARVEIDGLKKFAVNKDIHTDENIIVEPNNGMFPKEYDALAVMQTIAQAVGNRDKSNDKLSENGLVIHTMGTAKMLDGKTDMQVMLVLDAKSGKVVSAYPKVKRGAMRLDRVAVKANLGLDL